MICFVVYSCPFYFSAKCDYAKMRDMLQDDYEDEIVVNDFLIKQMPCPLCYRCKRSIVCFLLFHNVVV